MVGMFVAPNVSLDIAQFRGEDGWKLGLPRPARCSQISATTTTSIRVAPQYATAGRPAFACARRLRRRAGPRRPDATLSPSYWIGAYVRHDTLGGASFADSPLVKRDSYWSARRRHRLDHPASRRSSSKATSDALRHSPGADSELQPRQQGTRRRCGRRARNGTRCGWWSTAAPTAALRRSRASRAGDPDAAGASCGTHNGGKGAALLDGLVEAQRCRLHARARHGRRRPAPGRSHRSLHGRLGCRSHEP